MKIKAPHAVLLNNLKIQSLYYKMQIKKVNKEIFNISSADILKRLRSNIYLTAIKFDLDLSFNQANNMKDAIKKIKEKSLMCLLRDV